jgi:SAM-dependent methyltransferase
MANKMKILNLGCGTKTSTRPEMTNIDWSIYLRLKRNWLLRTIVPLFVKGQRLERFKSLGDNIMVHNLAKGIPFESNAIDVVYHSHLLEHLDKDFAKLFLLEIKRVLKPNGIIRIVVPDLEKICKDYISHISISENNDDEAQNHDNYITPIIEQSVRRESYGTSQQKPLRRFFENTFLGDARRRGETHQWMYDKINLSALLISLGYKNTQLQSYNTSSIPDWNNYGLDFDEKGNEYKPESLYIEASA